MFPKAVRRRACKCLNASSCATSTLLPPPTLFYGGLEREKETLSAPRKSLIRSVFRWGSCEISDEGGLTQQRAYGERKGVQQEAVGRDAEEQCYSAPFPF